MVVDLLWQQDRGFPLAGIDPSPRGSGDGSNLQLVRLGGLGYSPPVAPQRRCNSTYVIASAGSDLEAAPWHWLRNLKICLPTMPEREWHSGLVGALYYHTDAVLH